VQGRSAAIGDGGRTTEGELRRSGAASSGGSWSWRCSNGRPGS
jgi:hypothetical protein